MIIIVLKLSGHFNQRFENDPSKQKASCPQPSRLKTSEVTLFHPVIVFKISYEAEKVRKCYLMAL